MSGKQSRRRRRAATSQPVAMRRRQASPRVLFAAAVAVALAAVGIGLVASFGSGRHAARPLSGTAATRTLLDGIPQHGNVLGSPSAPVTVVEYADLQCPFCRDFDARVVPGLVSRYVRSAKVKVVFRPLAFIGPDSARGRAAVIAAGMQGKLFDAVQLLYANQRTENTGWLDDRLVEAVGQAIPSLDLSRFLADRTSAAVARSAETFDVHARADSVSSTPTLLVGPTGGVLRRVDPARLAAAIDAASRG
jgi:protein-disulfide isomerase